MNRIEQKFSGLRERGEKGLVVYIGAGDPDLEATRLLALAFDKVGVDVLELGIPFSDPLADGVVNQLAAQRGLESGTTPPKVLQMVTAIRKDSQIPIVFFVYYNLLHRYGLERFIQDSKTAGVDGLLVLDLPPEESGNYVELMNAAGLAPIFLLAPTTPADRIPSLVKNGQGFLYYISREGVTGMQSKVADTIAEMTTLIRKFTPLPLAIGFGISNPEQAKQVAMHGEAIVVGSAIVNQVAQYGRSPEMVEKVSAFVGSLAKAIKS